MKKEGFTLVELLAVIVILGIILIIAVPKIISTINSSKLSTLEDTAKMIAKSAEREYVTRSTLDTLDQVGDPITCDDVVNLSSSDYSNCEISFTGEEAYVSLKGIGNFEGLSCTDGTKDNANCGDSVYKDSSGANAPILYNNMIPVKYFSGNWVYADLGQKWYDYDQKEWANSVVLIGSPSKTYAVGDNILMSDIAMMYVWIPRYKYTIFNGKNGSANEQQINITFEKGVEKTGSASCVDNIKTYGSSSEICTDSVNGSIINGTSTYTHPAFTFGTTKLTGFWVAKFEVSVNPTSACYTAGTNCWNYNSTLFVKPDVKSWRGGYLAYMHTAMVNIATVYSINANSHVIKNMEWGAIAYLTYSKYGVCTSGTCIKVWMNPNSNKLTGQAGSTITEVSSATTNSYNTALGVNASTTKNVYGVYDMAGGGADAVMSNMVDDTGAFYNSSAKFSSAIDAKYYDKYTYDGEFHDTHSRGKLGDATKETMKSYGLSNGAWNDNDSFFSYIHCSWLTRGAENYSSTQTGLFAFSYRSGGGYAEVTSRPTITSN